MFTQVLREGFAQAHRRPGLVLLDVFWKAAWLALTLIGLLIAAYPFVSHFQWRSSNIRAVDALVAASLLRQVWNEYGGEFVGGLLAVLGLSAVLYIFIEAVCRRRLVRRVFVGAGFSPRSSSNNELFSELERGLKPAPTNPLGIFLGSNVARGTILTAAAIFLGLTADGSPYATVAGVVAFIVFAFLLTIIDTLLRSDAVDLLGADLLGVTGLIGTLLLFEFLVGASLLVVVVFGFLNVSSAAEALVMIGGTTLVLFFCTFLHSYLLVVRFSAVGIMRRNVIDL